MTGSGSMVLWSVRTNAVRNGLMKKKDGLLAAWFANIILNQATRVVGLGPVSPDPEPTLERKTDSALKKNSP